MIDFELADDATEQLREILSDSRTLDYRKSYVEGKHRLIALLGDNLEHSRPITGNHDQQSQAVRILYRKWSAFRNRETEECHHLMMTDDPENQDTEPEWVHPQC